MFPSIDGINSRFAFERLDLVPTPVSTSRAASGPGHLGHGILETTPADFRVSHSKKQVYFIENPNISMNLQERTCRCSNDFPYVRGRPHEVQAWVPCVRYVPCLHGPRAVPDTHERGHHHQLSTGIHWYLVLRPFW